MVMPIFRRRHTRRPTKMVVLAEYPPHIQNGSTNKRNRAEGIGSKRKRSAIPLTDLPSNVLVQILARLPLRTLFIARSVCKTFNSLTTANPHFINLRSSNAAPILVFQFGAFQRSSRLRMADHENSQPKPLFQLPKMGWDSNNLSLSNSCNGLLFFKQNMDAVDSRSLVCNPLTGEYIIIPVDPKKSLHSDMWLGFSPGTNQYKVLRLSSWGNANGDPDKVAAAQVFVIGSDSWTDIEDTPPHFWDLSQTFLNGFMYWHDTMLWPGVLVSFDFEREKFGEVALPPEFQDKEFMTVHDANIGVLGGCIYITCSDFVAHRVDLWVMRKCGNPESWRKEIVVDTSVGPGGELDCAWFKPLEVLGNGEILMQWRRNDLVCYDPRTKTFRYLRVCNEVTWDYKVVTLTPSFVPLKDALKFEKMSCAKE